MLQESPGSRCWAVRWQLLICWNSAIRGCRRMLQYTVYTEHFCLVVNTACVCIHTYIWCLSSQTGTCVLKRITSAHLPISLMIDSSHGAQAGLRFPMEPRIFMNSWSLFLRVLSYGLTGMHYYICCARLEPRGMQAVYQLTCFLHPFNMVAKEFERRQE